ncbi:hypothetical protein K490DRAFT_53720 [Saccharata proteae CBS 121410]|uniref:J domain-containing protein n=1 Tax=Saccharata proteae CBS 121410 TaxID=1314787 RepID=A0A9P4HWZ5_9PEZI|nr:hypothetical protein K490DRAFT_53720 [Saccharata proteae CBS 121410]
MRSVALAALLLCAFAALAQAWSKDDHEIFRLRDEVAAHEGSNATFYSFLRVPSTASLDDINKAYRKLSRQLHPDKARQSYIANYAKSKQSSSSKKKPGVTVRKSPSEKELKAFEKEASARFTSLGLVAAILRSPLRERYDHFLRNGFPVWRGTGYYYARFRPGLGSVLFGLFAVGGGAAHYAALILSWKRQREFVGRYVKHARRMAWGDDLGIQGIPDMSSVSAAASGNGTDTPPAEGMEDGVNGAPAVMNRRQKRAMEREEKKEGKSSKKSAKAARAARAEGVSTPVEATLTSGPQGNKKRVVAENGKVLIVDSAGNVFLEEGTEDGAVHEYLLDVEEIPKPTLSDTAIVRLPVWLYKASVGKLLGKSSTDVALEAAARTEAEEADSGAVIADLDTIERATAANPNAEARKRKIRRGR